MKRFQGIFGYTLSYFPAETVWKLFEEYKIKYEDGKYSFYYIDEGIKDSIDDKMFPSLRPLFLYRDNNKKIFQFYIDI